MKRKTNAAVWMPLAVMAAFAAGLLVEGALRHTGRSDSEQKFANILNMIKNEYVDVVDTDSIIENTIPALLANLDPHSVYIPAEDLESVNDELEGSFSGVGVSFSIDRDTIHVIEVVSGGPSERVGLLAGDRIIKVDDENVAGVGIDNDGVFKRLRGEKGSKVVLTVARRGAKEPIEFEVIRGYVPITSIDASYMITPQTGYIKVNKFARNTYEEFVTSLYYLAQDGADNYIVDLRGNPGGIMEAAVLMVNEFLPPGYGIVSSIGRRPSENRNFMSDGMGSFRDKGVVVLIDEDTASASEIFAGAIQDNDRGTVLGLRSFGKGLVQTQIELPDRSAVRLTVARYYTPSGRCIQKDYSDAEAYQYEKYDRYNSGEVFEADSVHLDKEQLFHTRTGRKVYGGGGIMPDVFVPRDTTGFTSYYINVANAGLLQKFTLQFADNNRSNYAGVESVEKLMSMLPPDSTLLRSFVNFCAENGQPARWYYINISRDLIVNQLKALIARDILGVGAYYEVINKADKSVGKALDLIGAGKIYPQPDESDSRPQE